MRMGSASDIERFRQLRRARELLTPRPGERVRWTTRGKTREGILVYNGPPRWRLESTSTDNWLLGEVELCMAALGTRTKWTTTCPRFIIRYEEADGRQVYYGVKSADQLERLDRLEVILTLHMPGRRRNREEYTALARERRPGVHAPALPPRLGRDLLAGSDEDPEDEDMTEVLEATEFADGEY